jgi:hypothetical protein
MALANPKHTQFYTTSGTDADKVTTSKLTEVQTKWEADVSSGNNLKLLDHPDLGPLLYQMQQMQDELTELRRYVTSAELLVDAGGGSLPTSTKGLSSGDLYNNKGVIAIKT